MLLELHITVFFAFVGFDVMLIFAFPPISTINVVGFREIDFGFTAAVVLTDAVPSARADAIISGVNYSATSYRASCFIHHSLTPRNAG